MKRFILAILIYIGTCFSDWLEGAADSINERNFKKAVINIVCIVIWGTALVLVCVLLVLVAIRNMHFVIIGGFLAAAVYSGFHKLISSDDIRGVSTSAQPTMDEYISVMEYVRVAAKHIGPALGLNSIFEETDIRAARDERILQHGNYWRFKYRLPKKNAAIKLDIDLARRVLQREIQSVLDTENSLGNTRMVHNGIFESVIQVDQVVDGDAYIYVYCVLASDAYFDQKQRKQIANTVDLTDEDF